MAADTYGAESEVKELFNIMANYGIVYLQAQYSGGNDEGGIQEIESALMADGREVADEHTSWQGELWSAADSVMSCKYGGWAFEGSAWGNLYADAKKGKVWTQGGETVDQEDPNPIEVNVAATEIGEIVDPKQEWRNAVINGETLDSYATWHRQWSRERKEAASG